MTSSENRVPSAEGPSDVLGGISVYRVPTNLCEMCEGYPVGGVRWAARKYVALCDSHIAQLKAQVGS